jgi:multiple sugar transport system permease protein
MGARGITEIPDAAVAARASSPRRGFRLSFRKQDMILGYLFIAIPMIIFLVFNFAGMFFDLWMSFQHWAIIDTPRSVGWANYNYLFNVDPVWWTAIRNTLGYVVVVVPIQTAIAFALALIVNQNIRGKTFFRTVFYFPSVTSSVAISLIFIFLFNKLGLVNYLLGQIGINGPNWINDPSYVLHVIEGQNIWTTTGTYMIVFLAALQDVPREVLEAAAIDGATGVQAVWRIVLPLVRPALFFVIATGLIGTFQVFDQAFVYSQGGWGPDYATTTAVLYIYNTAFLNTFYGVAAAASFVLFAIIFVVTLGVRRLLPEEGR